MKRLSLLIPVMLMTVVGCTLPSQLMTTECTCESCQPETTVCCPHQATINLTSHTESVNPGDEVFPPDARTLLSPAPAPIPPEAEGLRLAAMEDELHRLRLQREEERSQHNRLQLAVSAMNDRVARLTGEVDHWKQEVERIEEDAIVRQEEEIATIEQLANVLDQIPQATPGK